MSDVDSLKVLTSAGEMPLSTFKKHLKLAQSQIFEDEIDTSVGYKADSEMMQVLKDVEPTIWRLESKTDQNTAKINDILARLNLDEKQGVSPKNTALTES